MDVESKVVTIGSFAVGKTSLLNQYIYGTFEDTVRATIGGAYVSKQVQVENKTVNLGIWDTAGQDRFRSMAPMYCRGAHAAILVFDVSDAESLPALTSWLDEIDLTQKPILVCVGNKCDIRDLDTDPDNPRCIPLEECKNYAANIDAAYFETSSKTGTGVQEMFAYLAAEILKRYSTPTVDVVAVPLNEPPPTGGCCS